MISPTGQTGAKGAKGDSGAAGLKGIDGINGWLHVYYHGILSIRYSIRRYIFFLQITAIIDSNSNLFIIYNINDYIFSFIH